MIQEIKFSRKLMSSVFFVFIFFVFLATDLVFASETNGTIDTTSKYAWGQNIGWLNFGCDNCSVAITDSAITGYAWSSKFGWINLNPTNGGVLNTSSGVLSGRAWSSNLGWIDFDGVTINSSGEFIGYATLDSDSSQINFNCVNGGTCSSSDFKVKTDWRPASSRQTTSSGGTSSWKIPKKPINPPSPSLPIVANIKNNITNIVNSASGFLSYLFTGQKPPQKVIVEVPKISPLAFTTKWNLLPVEAIHSFVFAPLPYEIRVLAGKFPELEKTLKAVGVDRLSDLNKLTGVNLNAPRLSEGSLSMPGGVDVGKIALIKGLPIAKFSLSAKKNLPAEFVFARASGELVDLNVVLSVGDKGKVTQQIATLPGKILKLVVKPISRARSVTGYIVFNSATPKITEKNSILRSSLTASVLFSMEGLVEKVPPPNLPLAKGEVLKAEGVVEKKLVLSSFEYLDPDHDGIYTADVLTPSVSGEYEIITIIDYIDPVLGIRKMSMIAVIDPEGYIFEKNNGKETRIPRAIVSLYSLNVSTKQYSLWNAKDYSQDNPQITDVRGTYSFLVPAGSYYFHVEAPGYKSYQSKAFIVAEGNGIHQNIELRSAHGWLADIDWQNILLIVVFLLLVYNLYRNRLRDKLLNLKN